MTFTDVFKLESQLGIKSLSESLCSEYILQSFVLLNSRPQSAQFLITIVKFIVGLKTVSRAFDV